jgi:hypothetical protein
LTASTLELSLVIHPGYMPSPKIEIHTYMLQQNGLSFFDDIVDSLLPLTSLEPVVFLLLV